MPYIDLNLKWVYMCSSSWTPLPPPSPSQCTSPEHPVWCIKPGLVICFTYDNLHVSMPFSNIILPSPSPTESKFYLGQNEDCSLGGSISDSSERLLQSSSGGKSMYKVLVKGEFNTMRHSWYPMYPWDSPGKDTGVGCLPFSGGSSSPRAWTHFSCIAVRFFTTEPPGKPFKTDYTKYSWTTWLDNHVANAFSS